MLFRSKLDPQGIIPLVNVSIAHARMGQLGKAEENLNRALRIDPKNAAANFNMGLLKAEQGEKAVAEAFLRTALASDPMMGEAAYNLSVLIAQDRPEEALTWAKKAVEVRPADAKYAYTLAFYEQQRGNVGEAIRVLLDLTARRPAYANAYLLLGDMYEKQGRAKEAENTYRKILADEGLSRQERAFIEAKLKKFSSQ